MRFRGINALPGNLLADTEAGVKPHHMSILNGNTFVVSDPTGDIDTLPDEPQGFFHRDMRHLSVWQLRVNGRPLQLLSAAPDDYHSAVFFLVSPTGTVYRNPTLSIVRHRHVSSGMTERLEVMNHSPEQVVLELSLLFDADFADVFQVKDRLPKEGELYRRVGDGSAVLGYRRGDFVRETHLRTDPGHGALFTDASLTFHLTLGAHESWQTVLDVAVGNHRGPARGAPAPGSGAAARGNGAAARGNGPLRGLPEWLAGAPKLETTSDDLERTYQRSLVDLAALRFTPDGLPDGSFLPAAGLPWFMALFGRDSIITSYQALPFLPELARTTLTALAGMQAQAMDDFRDAEPGKILHELRHGELTYFHERPQSPYYGSADSTPLFLILLEEYERWTGDVATVKALEPNARAALRWLDTYGDLDGDGYIEYQTRNPRSGLVNQCWKDSFDSIVHPDGSLVSLPRATCELQGYGYDARIRCARLATQVWHDPALAQRLEQQAAALKERFNADFWLPGPGGYGLALDGSKELVTTITSNMGHLLWSGIVSDDRVDAVVARLLGPELNSGWGVRTLAEGQRCYNPIGYHIGTVWPHDNGLIAAGLARYGRREEATAIAMSVIEAARFFDYRLPEVFAGYSRQVTRFPAEFPTACSPQAWSSGTPLLLLRLLLGLEPQGDRLTCDPHVPERIGQLALREIPGRWGRADAG